MNKNEAWERYFWHQHDFFTSPNTLLHFNVALYFLKSKFKRIKTYLEKERWSIC